MGFCEPVRFRDPQLSSCQFDPRDPTKPNTDDQEKTAFMTDKGIYCYKVMPFGLKNAGSTYQRLVNMMFKEHLGRTMEVYIDDMLVKSERSIDHVAHLKQSFDILRQYKMKLNPTKCSFGVRGGKFLGYLVTQRGIEASPEQTVLRKPELTGRLAKWNIYLSGFDIEFKPKTAIKSQVLADFVAEFSPGLEPTTWGNIVYSIRCEFKATNNEAEYEALIAGLDIALRLGARQLHVRSDSLLVVNQVNGDFQAKDSKMMSYLKAVKDRIARFEHFLIEQIPRDLNMQADTS
ncbi:hypothetical protein OSB04_un000411 [Centaurea solstitialis]|uniref:Retrovirus-related Pol polyprotein from transposon opus n=1 Tax=Centaurea solstitialis TaxID=347529 RepID=A0AA38W3P7_9ASTR|nr:hypothetical protein OSB04_un000411 [Centaurea solstitialis]